MRVKTNENGQRSASEGVRDGDEALKLITYYFNLLRYRFNVIEGIITVNRRKGEKPVSRLMKYSKL
jgi:hypothetical protein